MAQMLKGGVIMDVVTLELGEDRRCMSAPLERPRRHSRQGGVARRPTLT